MKEATLKQNDQAVYTLRMAIRDGISYKHVPGLLKRVLKENRWQRRIVSETGEVVEFSTFAEFVNTTPPIGLGTQPDELFHLCADDPEALDLLTHALTARPGGSGNNQYASGIHDNVMNSTGEQGNTATYALRRLRRERPDLHQRVLSCEMSPHAAMVKAGFRKRYMQVPDDPKDAAAYLAQKKDATWLLSFGIEFQRQTAATP